MFFIISESLINENRDYYSFLNVTHDASDRDIDRSFQKLSRKFHPDKNKGDEEAARKFADINEAYGCLRDSAKRRIYDLWGEQGMKAYQAPLAKISPGENSLWSQVHRKGKTLHINFPVPLTDFYFGNYYHFDVFHRVMCHCPNAGFYCDKCRGRPTKLDNTTLTFAVEKGSSEKTTVLFKNVGDTSEIEAPGDLELIITSNPHPIFQRDGDNLHTTINITLKEAFLGFQRTLKHLNNKIIDIKGEINQGRKELIIKGKGMPKYMFPDEYGDLIVHPHILWPKNLSSEKIKELTSLLSQ